ncbi:MAG: DsrE/DsrF/DrsH-like family protein [Gammaproteobacteria bacterium]|nr:DsrE/DsrF/DrsH-like family protein [Gammaproteobacteria bacterium]
MEYSTEHSSPGQQQEFRPPTVTPIEQRLEDLEAQVGRLEASAPRADKVTLLVFSGELDKVLAGLMIATTAASMGMAVTVFFTFWGLNVLKEKRTYSGKDIKERMIDMMTPTGPGSMGVSQLNMLGAGRVMLKQMMKEKDVVSADELLAIAKESGVQLTACSMTMQVMGIEENELTDDIEIAGAASYLVDASRSGCTLFI